MCIRDSVDTVLEKIPSVQGFVFAVEYVPGQYDQRADSAEQCISMLTLTSGHIVRCARDVYKRQTLSNAFLIM